MDIPEILEGLWRSRHVRVGVGLIVVVIVVQLLGLGGLLSPLLGVVDPILIQSAGLRLLFAWAATVLLVQALLALDAGLRLRFRRDVWPELVRGNLAVAVYFGARVLAVAGLIGAALG